MILPGHLAGGYLATKTLVLLTNPVVSSNEITILFFVGLIASIVPDADLIAFFFEHKSTKPNKIESHRKYPTHAPFFWFIVSLFFVASGYASGSVFIQYIGWSVLVGSWSHFVLDSIEGGIMWLWPFSKKRMYIKETNDSGENKIHKRQGTLSYHVQFISKVYIKNTSFYIEILITCVAILVIFMTI
jgi:hypothetical protein